MFVVPNVEQHERDRAVIPAEVSSMRLFYSPQYVGSGHSFETTRKSQWIAESLSDAPIPGFELVEPASLTCETIADVHSLDYIQAIACGQPKDLAESQGFSWDEGLLPMVLSSNGGAVASAIAALEDGVSGTLSSGLHHAGRDRGAGYCTFNGLVLAAKAALSAGAKSVLILDLDAHCGGGTASLIAGESAISQVDISTHSFDDYVWTAQSRLTVVTSGAKYLLTLQDQLSQIVDRGESFDLCLYNAGVDPFEHCPYGGKHGITSEVLAERDRIVFEWCSSRAMPVAFMIAGGYLGPKLDQQKLVALHKQTLAIACQASRG